MERDGEGQEWKALRKLMSRKMYLGGGWGAESSLSHDSRVNHRSKQTKKWSDTCSTHDWV